MKLITVLMEMLRNLFHRPMTIQFPKETIPIADGYRGKHHYDISRCVSCRLCARICLNRAIEMVEMEGPDGSEKAYPRIDMSKCCFCSLCEDICPTGALTLTQELPVATMDPDSLILYPSSTDAVK